jgi:phage-related minor tail protein
MADDVAVQVATNATRLTAVEREVERLNTAMANMDEHGTRGVGVLQLQVTELTKDVVRLEGALERQRDTDRQAVAGIQDAFTRSVRRVFLSVIALLSPVYVAIIIAIVTGQLRG